MKRKAPFSSLFILKKKNKRQLIPKQFSFLVHISHIVEQLILPGQAYIKKKKKPRFDLVIPVHHNNTLNPKISTNHALNPPTKPFTPHHHHSLISSFTPDPFHNNSQIITHPIPLASFNNLLLAVFFFPPSKPKLQLQIHTPNPTPFRQSLPPPLRGLSFVEKGK